ncbi:bru-2 [Drosophila busckii]|uniref:Bru-2 n=1 Tax=Drosophila busckii TaxID=30019 RepID=A0A0M3QTR9_DROBS|nr:bru-2 [Drosophila busckii]
MLNKKYTEADVRQLFTGHGTIEECTVLRDQVGQSKGCAFVTFATKQNAIGAIKSCPATREPNEDCRTYCHKVVKPLLEYFRISAEKNDQYEKQQGKLEQQEATIKRLEAKAYANNEAPCKCYEEKIKQLEAEKETLKLSTKITELQTKLEEQQVALRKIESEKDKRIADLKEQIQNMNKNKQFEDKLERAEVTKCEPYGNSSDIAAEALQVPCDSKFTGAEWTVIQRRVNGSVNFNRTWEEYKNGFGDLCGNFWLGLEKLHMMTKCQPHKLYIQLEDFKNEMRYARYSDFRIGNEAQAYELLSVGKYTGTAGNAFNIGGGKGGDAKNVKFSTPDRDNDKADNYNCAAGYASGWWFDDCYL